MSAPAPGPGLRLLVESLAVYRVSRLLSEDRILDPLRASRAVLDRPRLSYLLSCQHCTAVHAAILVRTAAAAAASGAGGARAAPVRGMVQSGILALAAAGAVSAYRDAIER